MRNVLIYIHPRKDFGPEEKTTAKIQIDNSLDLGWKKEDIILATNFPWQYNGVKAHVLRSNLYCDFEPTMAKINAILELYKLGLVDHRQLYFYHDFDVYQNEVITEAEIKAEMGTAEIGMTDKGRMPRWNGGTIFFRGHPQDLFHWTKRLAYKYKRWDEPALMAIFTNNLLWVSEDSPEATIGDRQIPLKIPVLHDAFLRIKKINITYNFRMWNLRSTYREAIKPIRAVHFHPYAPLLYGGPDELAFFMYGRNKLNTVLMSQRLINIFHHHGF